jgi:hypothetical protein
LGLLKRNAVALPVRPVLVLIPFKPQIGHAYSVATLSGEAKEPASLPESS